MGSFANTRWVRVLAWADRGRDHRAEHAAGGNGDRGLAGGRRALDDRWCWIGRDSASSAASCCCCCGSRCEPLMSRWTRKYGRAPIALPEPAGAEVAAPVYHRILVPLDHTDLDRLAVSHAAAMAKLYGAQHLPAARGGGRDQPGLRPASPPRRKSRRARNIWNGSLNPCGIKGVSVETAIAHSASPTKEIVRYAARDPARPGDHGRARPRRAEGPDLRQHHQPGAPPPGGADADRPPGKVTELAAIPLGQRCPNAVSQGNRQMSGNTANSCGINRISWHVTCS